MKRIKMVIYGEPGVGKSVFASKAPKPFFITTDGNYEWLEEFGADPNAHAEVSSWSEAKKIMASNLDDYETIVIDLTEDLFKWCEYEYCARNKIEHISDIGYGKGYDATRNEFFIEISKLLSLDKNVILIMHGVTSIVKDRRGVEHTKYSPTTRMPDKLLDMIEGRVRYFLRCYLKDEELDDGTLIKRRYLSIVPKPDEFGIIRGVDENTIPHDIPLDFNEFAKVIKLDVTPSEKPVKKVRAKAEEDKVKETLKEKVKISATTEETTAPWEDSPKKEETPKEERKPVVEEVKETPKEEEKKSSNEETVLSNADKLAAIRAKLEAIKSMKK